MGLMQGRRMENCVHIRHALLHIRAVNNRPNPARKARSHPVETNHLVTGILQRTNQRLAQMSGAACNQDPHSADLPGSRCARNKYRAGRILLSATRWMSKAAEDCRTPKRQRVFASKQFRQVLECGSPLPLSLSGGVARK